MTRSGPFRGRVKPGKASSLMGMVVGLGFIVFGLVILGSGFGGPLPGPASAFMVVWILAAVSITGFHAYNLFTQQGASIIDVDFQAGGGADPSEPVESGDFDSKLRKLAALKADGLITEEEHQKKRAEILDRKW